MNKKITGLSKSYYFTNAIVIITDCGHKHIRPKSWIVKIGDDFYCPICDLLKDPNQKENNGTD